MAKQKTKARPAGGHVSTQRWRAKPFRRAQFDEKRPAIIVTSPTSISCNGMKGKLWPGICKNLRQTGKENCRFERGKVNEVKEEGKAKKILASRQNRMRMPEVNR